MKIPLLWLPQVYAMTICNEKQLSTGLPSPWAPYLFTCGIPLLDIYHKFPLVVRHLSHVQGSQTPTYWGRCVLHLLKIFWF
ncbi:hypothetical protein GDO81_021672 [Engystomops pustulosus]|uniref:Secreted protein n=1 Tax=Engystomops pustulosus TaxID=76066 RepID=A0AAV6ZF53_ENGPU|nr:hypothetical protein GDO81_021672 [Engystomops pustulosus]